MGNHAVLVRKGNKNTVEVYEGLEPAHARVEIGRSGMQRDHHRVLAQRAKLFVEHPRRFHLGDGIADDAVNARGAVSDVNRLIHLIKPSGRHLYRPIATPRHTSWNTAALTPN